MSSIYFYGGHKIVEISKRGKYSVKNCHDGFLILVLRIG